MKNKIIDNAITLFSEKGYYGTTLDDIAKSVNIKKASLYYHYDNKEEIYRKSVENCFNYFKTFILESNNDSNYSIDGLYQFYLNLYLILMKGISGYTSNYPVHQKSYLQRSIIIS